MPLPKPQKGQKKEDFLNSCMANSIMNDEYPDNKQRYAVCNSLWDKKGADNMKMEQRAFIFKEIRVDGDENPKINGYAAMFNNLSDDLGGFREKIKPGAFKKAIGKSDVRALWNHDPNYVLGRTKNKTLNIEEDDKGLKIEINPIMENTWVKDLVNSMRRGDVDQMSFGFTVKEDNWSKKDNENIRELIEIEELFDVSPVTYPAYPQTQVGVRSAKEVFEEHIKEVEEVENQEKIKNSFIEAGIEYEKLSDLLIRAKHGEELNDSDHDLINASIKVLEKYSKAPPDGAKGGKDEENKTGRLDLMRKRLELIEKTI